MIPKQKHPSPLDECDAKWKFADPTIKMVEQDFIIATGIDSLWNKVSANTLANCSFSEAQTGSFKVSYVDSLLFFCPKWFCLELILQGPEKQSATLA